MPSPVKTGLFPAATTTAKTSAPAPTDTGESFRDELVRRRGDKSAGAPDKAEKAEGAERRKAEPKRTEKPKAAKRTRPTRGEPAPDDGASTDSTRAAGEAAPAADAAASDAPPDDAAPVVEARAEAETDHEIDNDATAPTAVAAASALSGAVNHSPAPCVNGDAGGGDDVGAVQGEGANGAAVFHAIPLDADAASEPGEAPAAGETAPATTADVAGLFNDTPDESGAGTADNAPDGPPAGAAASAALPDLEAESAPDSTARPTSDPQPAVARLDATVTSASVPGTSPAPGADVRTTTAAPTTAPASPPVPAEVRFAEANHANIVTSMRGELLPNGGSMRIRLDPPQLGALQVTVQIRDGLITAAFETSSDEATRLLGHSLNHLKSVLESHGVAVDKLQVQQAPREAQAQTPGDEQRREQGGQSQEQEQSARQEQQRREMLRRMWRRLAGGQDPLDLTA